MENLDNLDERLNVLEELMFKTEVSLNRILKKQKRWIEKSDG